MLFSSTSKQSTHYLPPPPSFLPEHLLQIPRGHIGLRHLPHPGLTPPETLGAAPLPLALPPVSLPFWQSFCDLQFPLFSISFRKFLLVSVTSLVILPTATSGKGGFHSEICHRQTTFGWFARETGTGSINQSGLWASKGNGPGRKTMSRVTIKSKSLYNSDGSHIKATTFTLTFH